MPVLIPSNFSIKKIEALNINKIFKPMATIFSQYFPNSITKKEIDDNLFSSAYRFISESDYANESDYKRIKVFRSLLQKLDSKFSKGKLEAFILDFSVLEAMDKSEHNFATLLKQSANKYLTHISDEKIKSEVVKNYLIDFIASLYGTQIRASEMNFFISPSSANIKSIKALEEKINNISLDSLARSVDKNDLICELLLSKDEIEEQSKQRTALEAQFIKNFNWEIEESMLTPTWGNPEYVLNELKKDFFANLVNIDFGSLSQDKSAEHFTRDFIDIFFEVGKRPIDRFNQASSSLSYFFSTSLFKKLLDYPYFLEKLKKDNIFLNIFLRSSFVGREGLTDRAFNKTQQFLFDNFLSKKEFYPDFITFLSTTDNTLSDTPYYSDIPEQFLKDKDLLVHMMGLSAAKKQGHRRPNIIKMFDIEEFFKKENFLFFCSMPYTMKLDRLIDLDDYEQHARNIVRELSFTEVLTCAEHQGDLMFSCIEKTDDFLLDKSVEQVKELLDLFSYTSQIEPMVLFDSFYSRLPLEKQSDKELLSCLLTSTNYDIILPSHLIDCLDEKTVIFYTLKNTEILRASIKNSKYLKNVNFICSVKFEELYKYSRFQPSPYFKEISTLTAEAQKQIITSNALFYKYASLEIKKDLKLAKNYALAVLEQKNPVFTDKEVTKSFLADIPVQLFLDPQISLKVIDSVPHRIGDLVPREFWRNQQFILNFCLLLDKKDNSERQEVLKNVSPNIEKLFKAFDIGPGKAYNFMINYFEKIQLNKELKKAGVLPTPELNAVNKNKI